MSYIYISEPIRDVVFLCVVDILSFVIIGTGLVQVHNNKRNKP